MNDLDITQNDLRSFKRYLADQLADPESALYGALSGVQYSYALSPQVYTKSDDGSIIRSDTTEMIQELLISVLGADAASASWLTGFDTESAYGQMYQASGMSSMAGGGMLTLWQELLPGKDGAPVNELLTRQYDLIYGSWPAGYDQVVLVVDENNELDDMTLYALGLIPREEMLAIADGENEGEARGQWSYEEVCGRDFRVILPSACYSCDEATGLYTDLRESEAGLQYLYDNALRLRVTGIIRKDPDVDGGTISGKICYTSALTEYIVEQAEQSAAVAAQKADPGRDVLTGLPFLCLAGGQPDQGRKGAGAAGLHRRAGSGGAGGGLRPDHVDARRRADRRTGGRHAGRDEPGRDILHPGLGAGPADERRNRSATTSRG